MIIAVSVLIVGVALILAGLIFAFLNNEKRILRLERREQVRSETEITAVNTLKHQGRE